MTGRRPRPPEPWQQLAADQGGVITRGQLLALGLSASAATWLVDKRRWPEVHRGVYATGTLPGHPLPYSSRVWAGLLVSGPGAVVAGRTALHLDGLGQAPPAAVQLAVPLARHPTQRPGLVVVRRRHLDELTHPAARPPRLRVEAATLDVAAQAARAEDAAGVVLAVLQRRLTTAERLVEALAARSRHPWRRLLTDVLLDATTGVASLLERAYVTGVERAHRLPRSERNLADRERDALGLDRGRRYRDIAYLAHRVVIELDGGTHREPGARALDDRRDNRLLLRDVLSLRYGWVDVTGRRCEVATEVGGVLRLRGWAGHPVRCGPACPLPPS
ncbi:MAG: type IV toxin-antitoxin system AbiEi family antitoxin domain-containing protein [Kineosporiaceae bacterium]|nr:type IV toxin-antitoxin system AbiEi family antitoxin domain-containing protein [Kineosporiaceae bacterium]MBL8931990.1 type IV toxin-antitoxin system AbiEi family antitoxin domain-containing protein [Kineosporiaceae bacterium]